MDREAWLQSWRAGRIGFHQDDVHADLTAFWEPPSDAARVLVPLCGKSVDLDWLAARGHEVVGVELSPLAVMAVMERLGGDPDIDRVGPFVRHRAGRVTVLQGDWFAARPEDLGTFDRLWDRAALVAMSPEQRGAYTAVSRALLGPSATGLLNTFSYDQARMAGPPFSVPDDEVRALWDGWQLEILRSEDAEAGRFRERGLDRFTTTTWRLSPGRGPA